MALGRRYPGTVLNQYWCGNMPPFIGLCLDSARITVRRLGMERVMRGATAFTSMNASITDERWSPERFQRGYAHEHHADLLRLYLLAYDFNAFHTRIWLDADMVLVGDIGKFASELPDGFYANHWGGRFDNDVLIAKGPQGHHVARELFRQAVRTVIDCGYTVPSRPFIGRELLEFHKWQVSPLPGNRVSWGRGFAKLWDEFSPDDIAPVLEREGVIAATLINSESKEYLADKSSDWLLDSTGHSLIQRLFCHAVGERKDRREIYGAHRLKG